MTTEHPCYNEQQCREHFELLMTGCRLANDPQLWAIAKNHIRQAAQKCFDICCDKIAVAKGRNN